MYVQCSGVSMGEYITGMRGAGFDSGAGYVAGLGGESEGEESVHPRGEVFELVVGFEKRKRRIRKHRIPYEYSNNERFTKQRSSNKVIKQRFAKS